MTLALLVGGCTAATTESPAKSSSAENSASRETKSPSADGTPAADEAEASAETVAWAEATFGTFEVYELEGRGDDHFPIWDYTREAGGYLQLEGDGVYLEGTSPEGGIGVLIPPGADEGVWGLTPFEVTTLKIYASGDTPWKLTIRPMSQAPIIRTGGLPFQDSVLRVGLYEGTGGVAAMIVPDTNGFGRLSYSSAPRSTVDLFTVKVGASSREASGTIPPGPILVLANGTPDWTVTLP